MRQHTVYTEVVARVAQRADVRGGGRHARMLHSGCSLAGTAGQGATYARPIGGTSWDTKRLGGYVRGSVGVPGCVSIPCEGAAFALDA